MALFDWMTESGPVLHSGDLVLRPPRASDYVAWSDLRDLSRDYLQPWEPAWPHDDLSRTAFRRRLSLYTREMDLGGAWPFFILDMNGQRLVGGMTLSNIRRGVADCATLGYWIGQPFAGHGYPTQAARMVLSFAFDRLRLHRVEAACLPANAASRRVLEKAGFRHEGEARAYLKINGVWSDHLLFGIIEDEFRPGDIDET